MKGRIVITSKEESAYETAADKLNDDFENGIIQAYEISELASAVVFMFKRECDAMYFAESAMNMGFEYVHREV